MKRVEGVASETDIQMAEQAMASSGKTREEGRDGNELEEVRTGHESVHLLEKSKDGDPQR